MVLSKFLCKDVANRCNSLGARQGPLDSCSGCRSDPARGILGHAEFYIVHAWLEIQENFYNLGLKKWGGPILVYMQSF